MGLGMLVKWGDLILQITHMESWRCVELRGLKSRNVDKKHHRECWRSLLVWSVSSVSRYLWIKHPEKKPASKKCSNSLFLSFIHERLSSWSRLSDTHSWTRPPLNEALTCAEEGDNGRFRSRDLSVWSIPAEIQSHLCAFVKHMESMWSMLSLFLQIPLSDCYSSWFVLEGSALMTVQNNLPPRLRALDVSFCSISSSKGSQKSFGYF